MGLAIALLEGRATFATGGVFIFTAGFFGAAFFTLALAVFFIKGVKLLATVADKSSGV